MFTPAGHFGASYWIPATVVPFLLVTHAYIFMLLAKTYATGNDERHSGTCVHPYISQQS
jgi:hypothetical protein